MPELILVGGEVVVRNDSFDNQLAPSITALNNGGYAIAWEDYSGSLIDLSGSGIKLRIYDSNGNPTGAEILVNTTLLGSQTQPSITTLNNGNIVVTWTDPALVGILGANVHGQMFTAAGAPVGGEFVVNTGLLGALLGAQNTSDVVALAGGRFLVTFTTFGLTSSEVIGQLYDASGAAVGTNFRINTNLDGAQVDSKITALSNGGFIVTWEDSSGDYGDASGSAIVAQLFSASGERVGFEFRVNTTTTGSQVDQTVTTLDNGNFVVTWTDPSAGNANVRGQIYTSAGVAVGSEFVVNTVLTGAQTEPVIAALPSGGFVVVWTDSSGSYGDASGSAILAQAFDASGVQVGGPVLVNTSTTGAQLNPAVTVLSDGRITITWETPGTAGVTAIVSQQMVLNSAPTGIVIDDAQVEENATAGTVVGTVSATDPDGDTITYTLVDDGGGRFVIDADTGVITVAPGAVLDYETDRDIDITVRATDEFGTTTDQTITILLTNVDEFPTIEGTPGDDVITAPSDDTTTINGGGGNDTLTGAGGNDTLNGGDGNDTLAGMGGDDVLNGGPGDDSLDGGEGNDTVNGGGGNDTGLGGTGNDILNGGDGDDILDGGDGDDQVNGEGGNDTLSGGNDDDVLNGGAGTDTIDGGAGNDTIDGGADDDILEGGTGDDEITGGTGNDTLDGGDGNDILVGGDGNDTLDGGAGADDMTGGAGDDTYYVDNPGDAVNEDAGGGNDRIITTIDYALSDGDNIEDLSAGSDDGLTLTGNSAENTITGAGGTDTIYGLAGNDELFGAGGNDVLEGGDGDDTLDGGAGDDIMRGGLGNDTYSVDSAGDVIEEGADAGTDTVIASVDYTLGEDSNIENLRAGSNAGLVLTGNSLDNVIDGANGNDTISGLDGNDDLDGGAGDDTIDGGNGNDLITGGTGSDTLIGGEGDDLLSGGAGNDTIEGNGGNDRLDGGTGADAMAGGAGNDIYIVDDAGDVVTELDGEGSDTIQTRISYTLSDDQSIERLASIAAGDVTLIGNAFDNRIDGGNGNDTIEGRGGTDTLSGGNGNDEIDGGSGNDLLYGNAGDDTLVGGDGNDRLEGGAGADTMRGGLGADTYIVESAGDIVVELDGQGTDTILTSVNYTLGEDQFVEMLRSNSSADLILTGNSRDNHIDGGTGNDIVRGLGGDDDLYGKAGNDTVEGGAGNDMISGDDGDDTLDGGDDNDLIYGGTGTDTLAGGAGNDRLDGQAGTDMLVGGVGDDTYIVDEDDVVVELAGEGTDIVQARGNYTLAAGSSIERLQGLSNLGSTLIGNELDNSILGGGGNDTIRGLDGNDSLAGGNGNDTIFGGANDDVVRGDNGNDILNGDDGNDSLIGGVGNDTLTGGAGNDTLSGEAGSDTLIGGDGDDVYYIDAPIDAIVEGFTATGGYDTIATTTSYTLVDSISIEQITAKNDAGVTLIGNSFDNRLNGAAGADTLRGGGGNDAIYGFAGNDVIVGGAGRDSLIGGTGADRFVYESVSDTAGTNLSLVDRITDFSTAQGDQIDLSGIDAVTGGTNDAFTLVAAFTGVAGQLISVASGSGYLVQGDVNGDGAADFTINVTTPAPLTGTDFIL
ncbi:beta strand repeat-containing protein [Sphingomonas sanxanigenens]|uniref:beta strand repeat-containing protein n=1 Tax=Sphingomonas sanxanigenens TaxID=397260 RepID=UPI0004B814DE|nr:cadherin domain-containing protein [Sphingomonas sanxanigenens]